MKLPDFLRKRARPMGGAWTTFFHTSRERTFGWLFLGAAFVVLVSSLAERVRPATNPSERAIDYGAIAPYNIQAEFSFEAEDLQATAEARKDAVAKVPDTYRVDRELVRKHLRSFEDITDAIRAQRPGVEKAIQKALLSSDSSQDDASVVQQAVTLHAAELAKTEHFQRVQPERLALWMMVSSASVPKREYEVNPRGAIDAPRKVVRLARPEVQPAELVYLDLLEKAATEALRYVLNYGVLESPVNTEQKIAILRENPFDDQKMSEEFSWEMAPLPAVAAQLLWERIDKGIQAAGPGSLAVPADRPGLDDAATAVAQLAMRETLRFDLVMTEGARETARRQVKPLVKTIRENALIQRGGDSWTPQSRSDYETYLGKKRSGPEPRSRFLSHLAAHGILVALILGCLGRSLALLNPKRRRGNVYLPLALLVMCATLVIGRIVSYFDASGLLVPMAAGGILVAILTNSRTAVMTSLLTAVLLSVQYNGNWRLLVISCAMSFAGLLSIYRVRKRSDMTRAALQATGIGLLTTVALTLTSEPLFSEMSFNRLFLIALNGCACLFMVPGLLSPLERLFGITTDIQLLEYSDLNNEALSRLAIEVPATYAHSLMLGQLAEAAAEAIGANGLLARVCAYYHDIGKLRRPEYFAENQVGENVHDGLPPRLSARAVASHITEGIEMAREYHLPKPIVAGIVEHHGTCRISFFYEQACGQKRHGSVSEEDFRYPGPKPQSRETAILMICDALESAVRSIRNVNEERVRELADKLITARANDRQFDECELTLKDLGVIRDVATKRIITTQHRRIPYPDHAPRKTQDVVRLPGVGEL